MHSSIDVSSFALGFIRSTCSPTVNLFRF